MLDKLLLAIYIVHMNRKSLKERAKILSSLVDGNNIHGSSRMTGVSKNTVARLLVEVGRATTLYQNEHMVNLPCKHIRVDSIWSFAHAKQKTISNDKFNQIRDIWTWTAVCADTKLVPSWCVGAGSSETSNSFIRDLGKRMAHQIQLTPPSLETTTESFEGDVDLVAKTGTESFAGPTNTFSKKIENHLYAVSLHFMYYNFSKAHKALRTTPAIEAGVTDHFWTLEEIVALADRT